MRKEVEKYYHQNYCSNFGRSPQSGDTHRFHTDTGSAEYKLHTAPKKFTLKKHDFGMVPITFYFPHSHKIVLVDKTDCRMVNVVLLNLIF